jgi:hypothetical protein
MKVIPRVRLSNVLLLMSVLAIVFALYAQNRRLGRLRSELSLYTDPKTEAIFDALNRPLALTYADKAPLEELLKEIKRRSIARPSLNTGIPIYVDPFGLQEAEKSMTSPVRKPASADKLTLGEHLRTALDSLGLAYFVEDGFLMVTSKESLDVATGILIDPYLKERDALR